MDSLRKGVHTYFPHTRLLIALITRLHAKYCLQLHLQLPRHHLCSTQQTIKPPSWNIHINKRMDSLRKGIHTYFQDTRLLIALITRLHAKYCLQLHFQLPRHHLCSTHQTIKPPSWNLNIQG